MLGMARDEQDPTGARGLSPHHIPAARPQLCSALGIHPSACFNLVNEPLSCHTVIRGLGRSKPLLSKLQLGRS